MSVAKAEEILQGTVLLPGQEHWLKADVHPNIGFLAIQDNEKINVLGFGVGGWQTGENSNPAIITPVTDFDRLPQSVRTSERQNRGVGPRFYNTAQALGATTENPVDIGVYSFELNPLQISDKTKESTLHTVLKYAVFRKRASNGVVALRQAITEVHADMPGAEAVLYGQTVHGKRLQQRRNQPRAASVEPRLLIIRSPQVIGRLIGTYSR